MRWISKEEDGAYWIGPLPVLGGWVPFIGWRTIPVDIDNDPAFEAPRYGTRSFFVIEWLGLGLICYTKEIEEHDDN